ncbi:MAG: hypothetical protein ACOYLB_12560 [Phototrophicaceae bacterium]
MDAIERLNLNTDQYRTALAAIFDLLVSVEYYSSVNNVGWLYCETVQPWLIYPFTNTCPACLTQHRFHYHKSNKPLSGSIGSITSKLLVKFFEMLLIRKGRNILCLKGQEPVDIVFVDSTTIPPTLFFAEIKSAPLITLPLVASANSVKGLDSPSRNQHISQPILQGGNMEIALYLPQHRGVYEPTLVFSLGEKPASEDNLWIYSGFKNLLLDSKFLPQYLTYWNEAFLAYQQRDVTSVVYWLTNGCGQPVPRPSDWRKRASSGYESISDSKTSVGMDRTDDIKKATYQALMLGALGKPSTNYQYKTGIVSNIHPVRHFDEYLSALVDVVWASSPTENKKQSIKYHNLFDGIVTLTSTIARDGWVKDVFDFD